jgi:hypothetical protein
VWVNPDQIRVILHHPNGSKLYFDADHHLIVTEEPETVQSIIAARS